MNTKAEVFSKYLEDKEIKAFQVEEIADDAQHTVVYRSHIEVEGQQLPTLVLLDDSVFSMVRVQVAPQALWRYEMECAFFVPETVLAGGTFVR